MTSSKWRFDMAQNIGVIDRYFRLVVGLALLAFAFQNGLRIEGWRWLGLIGFVLLITALLRRCPAYALFGNSTAEQSVPQQVRSSVSSRIGDHGGRS